MQRIIKSVTYAYGLGFSSYLAVRILTGETFWLVALLDNFQFWLALGAVLSLLPSWLLRAKVHEWLALTPGIFILFTFFMPWMFQSSNDADHNSLRVATYNIVGQFSNPFRITDNIASLDADIIGLREMTPVNRWVVAARLAEQYPYQVLTEREISPLGAGLLSKYPIIESEQIMDSPPHNLVQIRAVIATPQQDIVVYSLHLMVPRTFDGTYDASLRSAQVDDIVRRIRAEALPVVVLCDCNLTDRSDDYDRLASVLTDAFGDKGQGLGFTFPSGGNTPLYRLGAAIRIDYVWYGAGLRALSAEVWRDDGTSDHFPVVAELSFE